MVLRQLTPISPAEAEDPEVFARSYGFIEAPTVPESLALNGDASMLLRGIIHRTNGRELVGKARWHNAAALIRRHNQENTE